jgi:hypothetical protein
MLKFTNDVFREPLTGIDMTDWHNYTILWEEDNSTFLVDGQVTKTLNNSPKVPLFGDVYLWNMYNGEFSWGYLDVGENVSIQVDYVHLFATKERFQSWENEIIRAYELINQAISQGINVTVLEGYYEEVNEVWQEGYYNYNLAMPHLELIIPYLENYDEIIEMFADCAELIEKARQEGVENRTILMMEGYYAEAKKNWGEYNQELAEHNLQKIIDMT